MSRDISPPPAKRRKTSAAQSIPTNPTQLDYIAPPKLDDTNALRLFSWNINGIAPFLQKPITNFFQLTKSRSRKSEGSKDIILPASLRGFLWRHNWPELLFLQEVKIAPKDTKTQDAVKSAVNDTVPYELSSRGERGPTYQAYFTLPSDPHNARGLGGTGKVYGVCSIICNDLSSKYETNIRTVDWDSEGRVSVIELQSHSVKLAIFNIYAVNGTDNPYRDSATGALRGTRHDRKLEFHHLLMEECVKLEAEGWDVILAGDMNVAPDVRDGYPKLRTFPHQHVLNRNDFHNKLLERNDDISDSGLNGVDVWRKMHGEDRRYTYYPRGREWGSSCDRVDYIIAGRKTWERGLVKNCGILDCEAERGPSDHVPIWVDLAPKDTDERKISNE